MSSCVITAPYPRAGTNPSRDLIVADLIGPLTCSIDNKRYVLVVQNFFSRLTTAIPISDKAEAKTQLQHWLTRFSNTCGLQIKKVWTDNGSEFKNHFLNDFLLKHGIEHEYSMTYEHHQNGRIERMNWTLSEIARTCLIGGNLPVKLWSYSFKHAMWIFNQTLHFDCKQTPYELISKQKPSFHLLRIFGAKAYIYDHTFKKDFSPHGFVGYHLGIASDLKGWLFWCPEKDTIVRWASAKIDKSSFFPTKPNISSIQALKLLDDVVIKGLATQDRMISTINSYPDPVSINPTHYRDVINLPERDSWLLAVEEELSSMNEQNVFEIIEMKDALRVRQITVASSTCQAEYIAMSFASKECLWLSHLFLPVLGQIVPKIYSDNKAAISIADNTASRKQTRHLIREFNLINEHIVTKKIDLSWVSTHDQLADIFTKALGQLKVNSFIKAIGSRDAG
ncbi:hypothetical protein O181_062470 [Austropuccinia psidii MF-1]|uniref:Integrase catalytic domain-containing protein n=1 Tax=Austropuccinia psidii MF-1 TaxID=1389203 RepID=A0A9Q3EPD5_9BASI|nr:hypothetical protein [Austropuccinia psidii MF-1]